MIISHIAADYWEHRKSRLKNPSVFNKNFQKVVLHDIPKSRVMAYEIIEENNPNNYFTSDNIPSLSYYRSFIWATFLFFTEPFLEAAAGGFAESLETSS